jgi:hypothetical protein
MGVISKNKNTLPINVTAMDVSSYLCTDFQRINKKAFIYLRSLSSGYYIEHSDQKLLVAKKFFNAHSQAAMSRNFLHSHFVESFPFTMYNLFPDYGDSDSSNTSILIPTHPMINTVGVSLIEAFSKDNILHTREVLLRLVKYYTWSLPELLDVLMISNCGESKGSLSQLYSDTLGLPIKDAIESGMPRTITKDDAKLYHKLGLNSAEVVRITREHTKHTTMYDYSDNMLRVQLFITTAKVKPRLNRLAFTDNYLTTEEEFVSHGYTFPAGTERDNECWLTSKPLLDALNKDNISYLEACKLVRTPFQMVNMIYYTYTKNVKSYKYKTVVEKDTCTEYARRMYPAYVHILNKIKPFSEALLNNKARFVIELYKGMKSPLYFYTLVEGQKRILANYDFAEVFLEKRREYQKRKKFMKSTEKKT